MGSWMLWTAVLLFQLLFPLVFAVSTLTMAVGTVFDRLICVPAQHPGSESSRAVIDYLLSLAMKTSARSAPDAESHGIGRQRNATASSGSRAQEPSLLSKLMQSPWQDGTFSLEAVPEGMAKYYWPFNDSDLAPLFPESIDADGNVSSPSDGGEIEPFRTVSPSPCPHTREGEGPEHESFDEDASHHRQNAADVQRLAVHHYRTAAPTSPSQNSFGPTGSRWQEDAVTIARRGNGGVIGTSGRTSTSPVLRSGDAESVTRRRRRHRPAPKSRKGNATPNEHIQSVQGYRGLQHRGTTASEARGVVQPDVVADASKDSGNDGWDKDPRRKRSTRTRIASLLLRITEADGGSRRHGESQWQDEDATGGEKMPPVYHEGVRRHRELLQSQEGRQEFVGGAVAQRHVVVHCSNSVSGTALDRNENQAVAGITAPTAVYPREKTESANYGRRLQRQDEEREEVKAQEKIVEVVQSSRRLQVQDKDEVLSGGSDVVADQRVANSNYSAASSSWRWRTRQFSWLLQRQPDERTKKNNDAIRGVTARRSLLSAVLGPQVILDITKRFGECSSGHMSLYKLLGEDAAVVIAEKALGTDNTIMGLIDSRMSNAKLEELKSKFSGGVNSKMDTQLRQKLGISDEVKSGLGPLSGGPTMNFEGLTKASTDAMSAFSKISNAKSELRNVANQLPIVTVKNKVNEAADALENVTADDEKGFKEDMSAIGNAANALTAASVVDGKSLNTYLEENLNAWDTNKAAMQTSVDTFVDTVKGMTKGFEGDVEKFFTQAKTQVRDNIGDCHPIYVIYLTTANTLCDGAVKPFAAFWLMVWLYLALGIPAWMIALALSSYYAKLSH
nr:uncharacterized protein LOC126529163 isoform X2 [Dermacentor andersoni]